MCFASQLFSGKDKKQREAAAYLYNNPVEKQLSINAVSYRWNFLAYAKSDHPFSEKLVIRKASDKLRKCIQEVKFMFNHDAFLNYTILRNCFIRLSWDEGNQLIDFIINTYNVVDYNDTIRLYGSYEKMLIAFDSNTGNDHDLKEEYSDQSYKGYVSSIRSLSKDYRFINPKEVLTLSEEERRVLSRKIANRLQVSLFIAETLLHIYEPQPKRFP